MIEAHTALYLVAAFLLVGGNAFFVAAEFAIVKVRHTRVEEMAASGLPGSALAREVTSRLDEYLGVCQLGITIVSLGLGWVGEEAFAALLEPALGSLGPLAAPTAHSLALAGAFAIITTLHIVLGELVPKSVAIRKPGQFTRIAALPLKTFRQIAYPVLWLLNGAAGLILKALGMRQMEEPGISEDELRILFRESIRKGVITPSEAEIMDRATRFSDRTARDVMVTLDHIVAWSLDRSIDANLEMARREKHTRYPVYDPKTDDLVGVINIKTLALMDENEVASLQESDLLKEILRVPDGRRIDVVLKEMRKKRLHIAAVVDERGKAIGMLTMEDIIEEIFGEIEDEFETDLPLEPHPA
jgi:magnesium and cobalt exporter, CNNM family